MVYPVNGGVSQQIPAANTFQPGGTEATKRPEENKIEGATRPSGTDTAKSASSETRNNGRVEDRSAERRSESRSVDTGAVYASGSRGSNVDLSV